jgi:hypothetical protein
MADILGIKDDFNTLARLTNWGYVDHWSMPGVGLGIWKPDGFQGYKQP